MVKSKRALSLVLTLAIILGLFLGTTGVTNAFEEGYSYIIASANSKIVHADTEKKDSLTATAAEVTDAEEFRMVDNPDGTISFLCKITDSYIAPHDNGKSELVTNKNNSFGDWQKFKLEKQTDGTVAIKSVKTNKYVTVDLKNGGVLSATGTSVGKNEKFTIVTPQKPAVPTGLYMSTNSASTIELSWAADANITGYDIYRSAAIDGTYDKVNTAPVTTNSYIDTGLAAATVYFYKVSAANPLGESALSDYIFATTSGYADSTSPYSYIIALANSKIVHAGSNPLSVLTASASDASTDSELFKVIFKADGNVGFASKSLNRNLVCADTYNVSDYSLLPRSGYSSNPGGWETFTLVPQGDGTVAIRANNGGKYVTVYPDGALKATSSTAGINEKFIIVTPAAPAQPTGLTVAGKPLYNAVGLSWTAPASSVYTGFNVYRSITSGGPYTKVNTSSVASTAFTDTTVSAGTTYFYVVAAVNARGGTNSTEISATTLKGPLAAVPAGLDIASSTADSIDLGWTAASGAKSYNVYRSASRYGTYGIVNIDPVTSTGYTVTGSDANKYYYMVSAVNENGESDLSAPISQEIKLFGPNVYIFDPNDSAGQVQATAMNVFARQEYAQFGSDRYALLFKPGAYNINFKVGFYTQVAGLGQLPDDVAINGGMTVDAAWMGGNATCNFWRSAENLAVNPTATAGTTMWGVSQAAPLRRVHINGRLSLADSGWSSGGFLADSKVDGQTSSGSQQQWFTRNTNMVGGWAGQNWNMVFVGVNNPPAGTWPATKYTTVTQTPVISEKPFLTYDAATGSYSVFVPALRTNINGTSWESGPASGTSISLDQFYVAHPETSTAASINAALIAGKNLLFTPGIYHLNDTIRITRADTVVLGLGLASLIPDNGIIALSIDDVDGVKVAGIIFDAGAAESPMLMEVGPAGSTADHSANPTVLSDLFFRIGGAGLAKATTGVEINSSNVIGDDFWVWRADHGEGSGWTSNTSTNGMIVNGDNVTMYALMVEHFQQYQTIWNGNGGRTYFYQSEIPYDIPDQAGWMSHEGTVNGYASYKVADTVTSHETWGFGIYSFFRDAVVKLNSAMEVPQNPGVKIHNACTVWLAGMAGSEITHVVNNTGDAVTYSPQRQEVDEYCNNVDQPVITPKTGSYLGTQTVNITSQDPTATIRYTTDGSIPSSMAGTVYTGPFSLSTLGTSTIKAVACKEGMNDSYVTTAAITITDNAALNKTASASSSNGANTPDKAFDGNLGTRWESAQSDPQSITVDLGQSESITGVRIVWEGASASDYTIEVSPDNATWTTAYTVTGGASGATLEVSFPTVTGRYVKMNGTARAVVWVTPDGVPMRYGYSIFEFEVYANKVATPVMSLATGTYIGAQNLTITDVTEGATIRYTTDGSTPTATNGIVYTGPISLSAPATTIKAIAYMTGMNDSNIKSITITITNSIAYNKPAKSLSVTGTNTPDKAFDNNITTRWESAQKLDPQWIAVDLGQSYSVTGAKIVWQNAAGKVYKIQVSNNDSAWNDPADPSWTDAYIVTNGTAAATLNAAFTAPVTGRYVRMYGTIRTGIYGYSIFEFEVYGTPAP